MSTRSKTSATASKARAAGNAFESILEKIHEQYATNGLATIQKVDPPTRVVGKGRIIYLENPFLDYVGTWTAAAGRMIVMEAKSTSNHRLGLMAEKGGLTKKQIEAMDNWHQAGAAVGLLWYHAEQIKVINWMTISYALSQGAKSLRWSDYPGTRAGTGWIRWDWLAEFTERGG